MGSMDRESKAVEYEFEAGGNSQRISTHRAAWQAIHLPAGASGNLTYEIWNETTESFEAAKDAEGNDLPTVPVSASAVIPVNNWVNYHAMYRINVSSGTSVGTKFKVINKT